MLIGSALQGAAQLTDDGIKGRCRELLQPAMNAGRMGLLGKFSGKGVHVLTGGSLEFKDTKHITPRENGRNTDSTCYRGLS